MKKLLAFVATILLTLVSAQLAVADSWSPSQYDSYTTNGTPSNFDIDYIGYQEFSDRPDSHFFSIFTKGVITPTQFNDGLDSWAMVEIDADLDGIAEYRIQSTEANLVGSYGSPARIFTIEGGKFNEITGCSPVFYSNISSAVKWVNFRIDWDCMKLPKNFAFSAYMEYMENVNLYFDYMPDTGFFQASHSFNNVPKVSVSKDAPNATSDGNGAVSTPSQAPDALEKLSPEVLKSVVTIFCSGSLGSGWSAKVELSEAHRNAGYKSFIVTNHHVVEDCINSGLVTLELNDGSSQRGYVISWDEANDLAGIVTEASVPGLTWRGQTPSQGWWVGVLGAPRGLSGYLTTGLISLVVPKTGELGTTSPVNPGNSGGPVFDREGRVIATVSWKLLESEGLAFAKTSPLLCLNIVVCPASLPVWSSSPSGSSAPTLTPPPEVTSPAEYGVFQATLASYAGKATALTAQQKLQIKRAVDSNPFAEKFICTGIRFESAPLSENITVRQRSKAACEYARQLNPKLSTWFQNKPTQSRSYAGKVLLTVKSPND